MFGFIVLFDPDLAFLNPGGAGTHKETRKFADQVEILLPGPQGRQDQLLGMQVKGDVAGLRLFQPQLLQGAHGQLLGANLFQSEYL